jgi:hypothetical protein
VLPQHISLPPHIRMDSHLQSFKMTGGRRRRQISVNLKEIAIAISNEFRKVGKTIVHCDLTVAAGKNPFGDLKLWRTGEDF